MLPQLSERHPASTGCVAQLNTLLPQPNPQPPTHPHMCACFSVVVAPAERPGQLCATLPSPSPLLAHSVVIAPAEHLLAGGMQVQRVFILRGVAAPAVAQWRVGVHHTWGRGR
jgi:hypothetical protein